MKKETFAKIIELPSFQVLVTKEFFNSDENSWEIKMHTSLQKIRMVITLGFKTQKEMNAIFKEFDQKQAEKFVKSLEEMLKGK
jgi:hypothetical protein